MHRKNKTLSQLEAEKSMVPPKPDRRTDISNYTVALLLKITSIKDTDPIVLKCNVYNI